MERIREQFETWWEINYHNGNPPRFGWESWRDGEGYKIDDDESELDGMWQAWQASRAAIEVELPRTQYYGDHWSGDWALDPELVVDSLNEAGVKVKS